jgi:threonyl-tRNA synthetase
LASLSIDFNYTKISDIIYYDQNNQSHHPALIRLNILESVQNTVKLLLELKAGLLPVWQSSVQIKIIAISEKYIRDAQEVAQTFAKQGFRMKPIQKHSYAT